MLHRCGQASVLRTQFPLPFYWQQSQLFDLSSTGTAFRCCSGTLASTKGNENGGSIHFTPGAQKPESLVSTRNSICSSALLSTLHAALSSQMCLEKLSADNMLSHVVGRGGGKKQETQAPLSLANLQLALCLITAFFMRIQVIRQNNSGQETWPVNSLLVLGKKFCSCTAAGSSECMLLSQVLRIIVLNSYFLLFLFSYDFLSTLVV